MIKLLEPRRMEDGTEYYLPYDVQNCIEQAAKQIEDSSSAYKELGEMIRHQKKKRCLALASNCALQKKKLKLLNLEDNFVEIVKIRAVKIQRWDKWCNRWLSLAGKFDKA